MKTTIRFIRNQKDLAPIVITEPEMEPLGSFLEIDIQESASGSSLLADLNKAMEGGQPYEISGNGYAIHLDSEKQIQIQNLFDETAATMSIEAATFCHCLSLWIEFLDTKGLISLVPKI